MGCFFLVMCRRFLSLPPFAVLLHLFFALPLQGPGGALGAGYFWGQVYLGVVVFNGVAVYLGPEKISVSSLSIFPPRGCLGLFRSSFGLV